MNLNDLAKLDDYQVTLSSHIGGFSGLLDLSADETFALQTGAQFSGSIFTTGAVDAAKGAMGAILDRASKSGMGSAAVSKFQTVGSSIQVYDGPEEIGMSVSMHMIEGISSPSSYKELELILAKITQPNFKGTTDVFKPYFYDDSVISQMSSLFASNANYKVIDNKMFTLTIGNWFEAFPLKVASIQRTYSHIKNAKGGPLFCKLTLNVAPYRALNAEELAAWFKV